MIIYLDYLYCIIRTIRANVNFIWTFKPNPGGRGRAWKNHCMIRSSTMDRLAGRYASAVPMTSMSFRLAMHDWQFYGDERSPLSKLRPGSGFIALSQTGTKYYTTFDANRYVDEGEESTPWEKRARVTVNFFWDLANKFFMCGLRKMNRAYNI